MSNENKKKLRFQIRTDNAAKTGIIVKYAVFCCKAFLSGVLFQTVL